MKCSEIPLCFSFKNKVKKTFFFGIVEGENEAAAAIKCCQIAGGFVFRNQSGYLRQKWALELFPLMDIGKTCSSFMSLLKQSK